MRGTNINFHTSALRCFKALALIGVIFVSLFATSVTASGSKGARPSVESSTNHVKYTITEESKDGSSCTAQARIALTTHAPILINGNGNFTPANGVVGGSGTENDPYIIENWDISAENAHGIEIRGTTAYFIIRNCYLHGGIGKLKRGIYLDNVVNGKIYDLTSCNWHGIYLLNSDNNIVGGCIVENNGGFGIYLWNSGNNNIENCIIARNGTGAYFGKSKNNVIKNCNVWNNNYSIYFYQSSNCNIENCIVRNSKWEGILFESSDNNAIMNSIAEKNGLGGIYICGSDNNTIVNCVAENNNNEGIYIYSSSNKNIITNCTCSNNYDYGIYLSSSSYNTLINNTCSNNFYGIYIGNSDNNRIYHNNFISNVTQAYDSCSNYWDNGYPSGGNYWSNYTGTDNYRGENQDIPGSDGIGDTPYYIPGGSNLDRYPLMNAVVNGLVSRPPIYIKGNDNFIPTNGVTGGYGTVDDPYIIEGWDFVNVPLWQAAVDIRETDAYFIIRYCRAVVGVYRYGVTLYDVQHATVRNNEIRGASDNCYYYGSAGIVVSDYSASVVPYSALNTITNNSIKNFRYGIEHYASPTNADSGSYIINNTIANTNEESIYLLNSKNLTVKNNYVENAGNNKAIVGAAGIKLVMTENLLVENNIIVGQFSNQNWEQYGWMWYGIWFSNSVDLTIRYNEISNCQSYGIYAFVNVPSFPHPYSNVSVYMNNIRNTNRRLYYHDTTQGYDDSLTYDNVRWDNGTHGNYWDNYIDVDANGDNIWDNPYTLGGSYAKQDHCPLTQPFETYLNDGGMKKMEQPPAHGSSLPASDYISCKIQA